MEEEKIGSESMEQKLKKEMGAPGVVQNPEAQKAKSAKGKNTGMAIVAYIVFFIPLLTEDKNDPFVKFHVKQGLVLFTTWIAVGFLSLVPVIGWTLSPFMSLAMIALAVIGIVNAGKGLKKELPIIGKYADNFKI